MNQKSVMFTTDTGSPVTIISERIFNIIEAKFNLSPIRHNITVANRSAAIILGYADIILQLKYFQTRAEVIVVKDLSRDCLLGMDLLESCPLTKEPIKSDGSIRFTVDYKKLNSITVKDNYPLPIIDDLLRELVSAKYYSKMDLEAGYYCIRMHPSSKKYTAFLCEFGLFQWTRLPMGLKNSGATFSRAMRKLFEKHIKKFLYIYMDDFVIYSRTPEEHAEHLRIVVEQEIEFLGHLIRDGCIKPSRRKVEALFRYQEPTTVRQLLGFLGLAGHYRKFIEHFAEIAHSLYECASLNKANKRKLREFTDDCRKAFNTLSVERVFS